MGSTAGWYPQPDGQQRYWYGLQWTDQFAPGAPMTPPTTITNTLTVQRSRPANMAHGLWYWLLLGWW